MPKQLRPSVLGFAFSLVAVMCFGCASASESVTQERPYPNPPKWIQDTIVYQVNLRQFSEAGNLDGFREQLPRLKALGVGVLWFMPIHPIGVEARSGGLGSPYAVRDYLSFSEEFGTLDEFKATVREAHDLGMYVIIDWVPNHTSPDHPWVQQHPDWYTRDENGDLVPPIPLWADVVDLNFDSMEMRRAMIEAMAYWVREADIDGFRVDTAEWQPLDFWVEARNVLREIKPIFMLAEGAKPELLEYAFDAAYAWDLTPNMNQIKEGTKNVSDLVNYLNAEARIVPNDGFRLNFTTNHDINAWEATAVERMGEALEAFTVLTFTVNGMPLIYNGQEARLEQRLNFFDPDPIVWREDSMADLYRELAELKRSHPALWHGGTGGAVQIIQECTNESVLTFQRQHKTQNIVVMLNLSDTPQRVTAPTTSEHMSAVLSRGAEQAENTIELQPWGYMILSGVSTD